MLKHLKSEFVRNIGALISATFIAQILSYLAAPIITRLYSPEEFGELGIFLRIVAIGAALATLRYEQAIPIIKNDSHSFRLFKFVVRLIVIISAASTVIIAVPFLLGLNGNYFIMYALIPIGIALSSYFLLGTNWLLRFKKVKHIGLSRVLTALGSSVSKIIFGVFNLGFIGLIYGTVIGFLIGILPIKQIVKKDNAKFQIASKAKRNALIAKQHIDFPKINLPHGILDYTKDLIVAVLFIHLFTKEEYGLYDHTYRMLRLPLALIGTALGQMFFQRCAEMINKGEDVRPLILKSLKTLSLIAIVPFGILMLFGEDIFPLVFGHQWAESGRFSEIMSVWFALNFIISPITSLPLILKRQGSFFKLAIFGSIFMIVSILVPAYVFQANIIETIWVLSIGQTLYLAVVIYAVLGYLKKFENEKDL
jgi:teichuronic acid exporter